MTYREALDMGYKPIRRALEHGYISRKVDIMNQPVLESKSCGKYIQAPLFDTNHYFARIYISKEGEHEF